MKLPENDVFKMVSLRGAADGLVVDPGDDVGDSDVITILRGRPVDPARPSPEVVRLLADVRVLDRDELGALELARAAARLADAPPPTPEALRDALRGLDLARMEAEYRRVVDSWLAGVLKRTPFPRDEHELLIRPGHLLHRLARDPGSLREPGTIARILSARVVFPHSLRSPGRRAAGRSAGAGSAGGGQGAEKSTRRAAIEAARARFKELERQIALFESLQRRAAHVYFDWKRDLQRSETPEPARGGSRRARGALGRLGDRLLGRPVALRPAPAAPRRPLDDEFYSRLMAQLSEPERALFTGLTAAGRRPPNLSGLIDGVLDPGDLIVTANDTCSFIRVFEEAERAQLPPPSAQTPAAERPSVRAIGWGDLIVARERLVGYGANEIAHIENVLAGEEKTREHERKETTEEVTEVVTVKEEESERDLQTTDRHELQKEVQTTIQEDFAVEAGVNTSGRYGLTKVETSLDVGFQRSSAEARSSAVQVATEIVAKTVERVFESVRKLRRLTITEQIRELNTHALRNLFQGDGPGPPAPISGVYLWVEKVQSVELRHYGTRLMVEFHIPEPGLSLFDQRREPLPARPKPAPFTLGPADVSAANYLCLAKAFGAQGVAPPPAQFVDVGFAWRSAPDEEAEGANAEDTVADFINVPDGYRPLSGEAHVTAIPRPSEEVYLYLAVGGREVVDGNGSARDAEWVFDEPAAWPGGIPVSLLAHGHWDKTLVLQVVVRCQRTAEAMTRWQVETWEKLREAHQLLVQEYERAVQEAQVTQASLFAVLGRPAAENRQMEKDELKKWAIKTLRIQSFTDELVDAVVQVGDHAEIDPLASDAQAPIVRFFEEAFEWREMSYFLYPYFWGRRDAWLARLALADVDPLHALFLRAGAARVIVSVTPGYEERVLHYLDSDANLPELERIRRPEPGEVPPGAEAEDLWLELMMTKNVELALGSGTLTVRRDEPEVGINADSRWDAGERDMGRELFIAGDRYLVSRALGPRRIALDRDYEGEDDTAAKYTTGSVPFGAPWLVRIPTRLIVLRENTGLLGTAP